MLAYRTIALSFELVSITNFGIVPNFVYFLNERVKESSHFNISVNELVNISVVI